MLPFFMCHLLERQAFKDEKSLLRSKVSYRNFPHRTSVRVVLIIKESYAQKHKIGNEVL